RRPRKRSQIAKGFIERTLSDRNPLCRAAKLSGVGRIRQLLVHDQVHRQTDPEPGYVRCDSPESPFAFRCAEVHMNPGDVAVNELVQERRGQDVIASRFRRALLDVGDLALQFVQELFPLRKWPDALAAVAAGFLQYRMPVRTVRENATVTAGNRIDAGSGQRGIVDDEPGFFPAGKNE